MVLATTGSLKKWPKTNGCFCGFFHPESCGVISLNLLKYLVILWPLWTGHSANLFLEQVTPLGDLRSHGLEHPRKQLVEIFSLKWLAMIVGENDQLPWKRILAAIMTWNAQELFINFHHSFKKMTLKCWWNGQMECIEFHQPRFHPQIAGGPMHLIGLGFTHIHTTLGSCHGILRLERRRCLQPLKNGGL